MKIILSVCAAALISCGSSIHNAQDFEPNKAPVIEGYSLFNDATGAVITDTNVTLGTTLKCVIWAYDPEKKPLTFTFDSDNVSRSSQTLTDTGCEGTFIVTNVPQDGLMSLTVTARDVKGAASLMSIPIGKGQSDPALTVGSPSRSHIGYDNSASFTFSSTSDGWYQVIESADDVSKAPKSYVKTATVYSAGETVSVTVGGPGFKSLSGTKTVNVSSGDGEKKIWVIFKDNNNYYSALNASVTLDTVNPRISTISPADGSENIATSPNVTVVFNENMDSTSLSGVIYSTGGSVQYLSYDDTRKTAKYVITGLSKNLSYSITAANAKDLAGNSMDPKTVSFKTTPTYAVTYDPNNADGGTVPESRSYSEGEKVTVSGNTGSLVKNGYTFKGWVDGLGTSHLEGTKFDMPAADISLYAVWVKTYSDSVTLETSRICLDKNKTRQMMDPVLSPKGIIDSTYTWSSSAPAIATVSSSGLITGIAAGSATVTATAAGGASANVLVTVMDPVTVTTFASGFSTPVDMTILGTSMYVADRGSYSIKALKLADNTISTLKSDTGIFPSLQSITTDGTYLFTNGIDGSTLSQCIVAVSTLGVCLPIEKYLGGPQQISYAYVSSTPYLLFADYVNDGNNNISLVYLYSSTPRTVLTGSAGSRFKGVTNPGNANYACTVSSVEEGGSDQFYLVAGSRSKTGYDDGVGNLARFSGLSRMAHDDAGNLYASDTLNHNIRKITAGGVVTTIAGNGSADFTNGSGASSSFNTPIGIYVVSKTSGDKSADSIYVADSKNNVIRKIQF
jgi:uncharacterized repeat protein (TIGR02543 family)